MYDIKTTASANNAGASSKSRFVKWRFAVFTISPWHSAHRVTKHVLAPHLRAKMPTGG
jgi:hypothetical protein